MVQQTIFLNYQMTKIYTKWPKSILNDQKLYQKTKNYTKRPKTIPKDQKLCQIAIKIPNFPILRPTKIVIFGIQIHHLATLLVGRVDSNSKPILM
jgi:hypothetical protein